MHGCTADRGRPARELRNYALNCLCRPAVPRQMAGALNAILLAAAQKSREPKYCLGAASYVLVETSELLAAILWLPGGEIRAKPMLLCVIANVRFCWMCLF